MKFGKRLSSEAARSAWEIHYFDYKATKKAIKEICHQDLATDTNGQKFNEILVSELSKVSQFYAEKAQDLESILANRDLAKSSDELNQLRVEVQELIKFVALNYLAVVKAIKKRNKALKERFGDAASSSLHALDLLGHEVFFTSPRLAALATQAEILSTKLNPGPGTPQSCPGGGSFSRRSNAGLGSVSPQLLEEYLCPICLETLHNPVVLTCAHRFCWGCLVAHCTASRNDRLPLIQPVGGKKQTGTAHGSDPNAAPLYGRVLEQIAKSVESDLQSFYNCPVCRKPQVLDIESLQVDTHLNSFIEGLTGVQQISINAEDERVPWGILPPQPVEYQGKLTVLLDLDGTLISSFTPRRAPRLPSYVKTHVVGIGSKLNPQGVFVVERPGLKEFLEELCSFAEVIIFTAGLEDYARPIVDAIDPTGRYFSQRIYRDGTLKTEYYQCVKDMARVNRSLCRTVLVDDTPLAFLHQPDNGVPVLGFRGDPDDRLLLEAVLPLLQVLDQDPDVRPMLHRRFDMSTWFKRHGFPVDAVIASSLSAAVAEREKAALLGLKCGQLPSAQQLASNTDQASDTAQDMDTAPIITPPPLTPPPIVAADPTTDWLLLSDFDRTLVDFDVGERLMENLAPELLPMLIGLDPKTGTLPVTNTLLAELQRRGVSRDQMLLTLRTLSAEVPPATLELLSTAKAHGSAHVRVISDANSVFVSHVLAGAKLAPYVDDVLTNPASFERLAGGGEEEDLSSPPSTSTAPSGPSPLGAPSSSCSSVDALGWSSKRGAVGAAGGAQRLVVRPHCLSSAPHCCPRCPESLCKGHEVRALRQQGRYRSIVFCGDGADDVCAAVSLGPRDHVMARRAYPLADYLERNCIAAKVTLWDEHKELNAAVQSIMGGEIKN